VARPVLPISPDHPAILGMIALLAGGMVCWYGWRRRRGRVDATYALKRVSPALLAAVTVTVAGLSIVLSEADNALQTVLPPPRWLAEFFERLVSGQQSVWGSVFALVVAAPFAEEPIFRGLMLRGFVTRYPAWVAVLGTALLFGIAHMNPWQFVGAVTFGLVAGWWVLRSGSLVPAIWGHAFGNGLPSITQALGIEVRGYTSGALHIVQFQPLWFDVMGVALVGVGLWLTTRRTARAATAASPPA